MLSAARGAEPLAPAVHFQGRAGESSGGSQRAAGACGDSGCCAPTDSSFFVQEDFRGDLSGDVCLTLELSIGRACNVKGCLWRELEMKTQSIVSKSSSVIGIAKVTTQDMINSLVTAGSKPPKKSLSPALSDIIRFGLPRDANDPNYQLIDPIELMAIDTMALTYPKYYRCTKIDGKLHIELSNCAIQPVDALTLLFNHWIGLSDAKPDDNTANVKKKTKGTKSKLAINIVVPNSFNSATRAKIALAVQGAGAVVNNIFSRGLAAVAGALHRDKGTTSPLYLALLAHAEARKTKDSAGISPLTLTGPSVKTDPKKANPFTKQMIVLFIDVDDAFVELSVISCEGGKLLSEGATNCMGFDRIVSLAHMGLQLDDPEDLWANGAVVELAVDLLSRAGDLSKENISVVLTNCLDQTMDDLLRFLEDPNYGGMSSAPGKAYGDVGMPLSPSASVAPSPKGSPMRLGKSHSSPCLGPIVVKLVQHDVVRGGCVLSAAELQSSKLYVHEGSENSFNVSYYLSVGEDDSGGIYGVVITDPNMPEKVDKNENRVGNRERTASGHKIAIDEKPTEILPRHQRLAKPSVGPALKRAVVKRLDYTREFKYLRSKLMYFENSSDPTSLTGGSRLRLFQQVHFKIKFMIFFFCC